MGGSDNRRPPGTIEGAERRPRLPNLRLVVLYLVITTSFLNLFFQFPLTPVRARELTADPTWVALAVSAYSLANLVGNLFAGLVVDRFPKGPVMASGLAMGGLALVAAGQMGAIGGLTGALMLNGLALAVVTPAAFALLSEALPEESRARGLASSGAAIGVAALVGPPVAGVLADRLGQTVAFQAAGGLLIAVALLAFLGLGRASAAGEQEVGLGDLVALLGDRRLHQGLAGAFFLMVANGSLVYALPAHLKQLGYPGRTIGMMFSLFAAAAIAVFLSPVGRRAFRGNAPLVMAMGAGAIAIALGSLSGLTALVPMGAAMLLYGLGFGLIYPAALSVVVAHAPAERRGTAFGLFYAMFSLGAAVGPFLVAQGAGLGLPAFAVAAVAPGVFAVGLILVRSLKFGVRS